MESDQKKEVTTCTQCREIFTGEDGLCPHCAEVWDKINQSHEKKS